MVQRLEHLLNGEKLNQQDSYGKETPKVNKIMSGPCLFTFCCNSTNINDRKNCFVATGTLTTASVWTWSGESHESLCCPAASSQEVVGGWEKEKEDAQGQPSGETLDETTDQKQKRRAITPPATHNQGGRGCQGRLCRVKASGRGEKKKPRRNAVRNGR